MAFWIIGHRKAKKGQIDEQPKIIKLFILIMQDLLNLANIQTRRYYKISISSEPFILF